MADPVFYPLTYVDFYIKKLKYNKKQIILPLNYVIFIDEMEYFYRNHHK